MDTTEDLRDEQRQVFHTTELPPDLAAAILAELTALRAPSESEDDDDTIIG